jgi:hypothetical protein
MIMKIRTSQLRFLGSLALVIVIILLTRGLFNFDEKVKENNKEVCIEYKRESFSGRILDTYKSENRGTFVFILMEDGKEKEHYNYCILYPEAYIEKGDSIYKVPNSFEYHIYRGGDPSQKEVLHCEDNHCDKWK